MTIALEQALLQRYIDGSYGLDVSYENADFDASAFTKFAKVDTFLNDVTPFSLKHSDETSGFFQVILYYLEGDLSWDAKQKAAEIVQGFKVGTRLNTSEGILTINRYSQGKGANEDGWFKIVLRFYFVAVLPR